MSFEFFNGPILLFNLIPLLHHLAMGPIKGDRARTGIAVGNVRLDDWWDAFLLRLDHAHDIVHIIFEGGHVFLHVCNVGACFIVDCYLWGRDDAVRSSGFGCCKACAIIFFDLFAVV